MGQIAIPIELSKILTIPERVTSFNIKKLTELINNGKANFVIKNNGKTRLNLQYAMFRKGTELLYGDIVIKPNNLRILVTNGNVTLQPGDKLERDGKILEKIRYTSRKNFNLNIGDMVERHLRNKDVILLNRQPTLHSGSMMANEIILRPGKTIRMNLSSTKSYNADIFSPNVNTDKMI